MGGFSNPIVGGGGALVYPAIHSPGFVHSVSGWTINKDGSAEFNNLTIRGTFFGTDFIINSSGIFLYSGTPALGNLTGSWAPVAGADSFGNAYKKDLAVYAGVNTGFINVNSTGGLGGNTAMLLHPGGTSHATTEPQMLGGSFNGGAVNEIENLHLSSGQASANDDAALLLQSSSADNTTAALADFQFGGTIVATLTKLLYTVSVPVTATAGSISSPTLITTDSWHLITMDANWSTLAGQTAPQYRLNSDNSVDFIGAAQFNAAFTSQNIASGANVLPAAYRPVGQQYIGGGPGAAGLQVSSNGNLLASASASTQFCNFNGRIRLGI